MKTRGERLLARQEIVKEREEEALIQRNVKRDSGGKPSVTEKKLSSGRREMLQGKEERRSKRMRFYVRKGR